MAQVLNKYRDGIPKGSVYIGRPSKWGNPFVIGKDGDRDEVIAKYRQWLMARPEMVEAARRELAGKDLVCFCAPKACHGDVLVEVANVDITDADYPEAVHGQG
jgi:hypothetical protein